MNLIWLMLKPNDVEVEREQLLDEGRDISSVERELKKLASLPKGTNLEKLQPKIAALLDKTQKLPMKKGYTFVEPSDLAGIKKARPKGPRRIKDKLSDKVLFNKVLGAWLGRCSGCLLGKPVEGVRSYNIWGYLKELRRYPLSDYFHSDVPKRILKKYGMAGRRTFINEVPYMVEDDDTNYTVTGLALVKEKGINFVPEDMADFWINNIPLTHTCTAERVAYKNFALSMTPPHTANFRNPYREWIGAQIRGDFFGYVALGNPELAAELAWRDASISHIKNGIYGEMWVAAMLAAAPFCQDTREVIEIGLTEIPARSRLTRDIHEVMSWYDQGVNYEEAVKSIHQKWDEKSSHHWCHTNSNAQIVAVGLLWGEGNFERSICRAVQPGFDTDCNGATVGSIVGMMLGAAKLPRKWVGPLHDKIATGIAGYNLVKISDLAKEGFELYKKYRKHS